MTSFAFSEQFEPRSGPAVKPSDMTWTKNDWRIFKVLLSLQKNQQTTKISTKINLRAKLKNQVHKTYRLFWRLEASWTNSVDRVKTAPVVPLYLNKSIY